MILFPHPDQLPFQETTDVTFQATSNTLRPVQAQEKTHHFLDLPILHFQVRFQGNTVTEAKTVPRRTVGVV